MSEPSLKSEGGYVRQAWLVILLAVSYGAALAGVETTLGPKIAENKRNETYDKIPNLVPGADKSRTVEMLLEDADGNRRRVYQALGSDGSLRGWVLPAGGQGFADRIELLIGLDAPAARITGLYVLEQKETPGLGDYIAGPDFQSNFRDKPTAPPLEVVKGDPTASNEIPALTGATISSEAVAAIANAAIAAVKEAIRKHAVSLQPPPRSTKNRHNP